MKNITLPFFISHQGCPHRCFFCDQSAISSSCGNFPSSDEIVATVDLWRKTAAGRKLDIAFFGGSFTALSEEIQEALLEPLQPLFAAGVLGGIRISTRPDSITAEKVGWLAERHVKIIEIGVQSMDDKVLAAANRGHDAASSIKALCCIKECGLIAGAQLMPGLPGDSAAKSLDSLEQVLAAGADFLRIYPVVVIKGTELAKLYQSGEYSPPNFEDGVKTSKILLQRAMQAGVDVIRIGLQATDDFGCDVMLAGCWHPALGQIVRSELYFDLINPLVSSAPDHEFLTIRCHPARVSDIIGNRRRNFSRFDHNIANISVIQDDSLLKEEVIVLYADQSFNYNIVTDLKYKLSEV